jgi:hypothetical protein
MNERIKELAKQASILSRQEHPELGVAVTLNDILGKTDRKVYVVDDYQTQKFAELIIQECQHTVDRYIGECDEISSLPETVLKKHFGIE